MHRRGANRPRVLIRYAASLLAGSAMVAGVLTATLSGDDGEGSASGQVAGRSAGSSKDEDHPWRLPAVGDTSFVRVSDTASSAPDESSPWVAPSWKNVAQTGAVGGADVEPAAVDAAAGAVIAEGPVARAVAGDRQERRSAWFVPTRLPPADTAANLPNCCSFCQQPACECGPQFDQRALLRPLTLNRDGSQREISVVPKGLYHKISPNHISASMSALLRPFTMANGPDGVGAIPPGLRRGSQFAAARTRRRCIPPILQPLYLTSEGDLMEGAEQHRIVAYVRGLRSAITEWPGILAEPLYGTGVIAGEPDGGGVKLVAFQEEGEDFTGDGLSASGGGPSESLEEVPAGEAAQQGQKQGIAGDEKLGEAPEDNSLQFLRFQTVLLEPGEAQFDVGLLYSITEDDFPLFLRPDAVVDTNIRQRRLIVPLELRYGLTPRMQAFINVPFGWANAELNFDGFDLFENAGGIGDVRGGLTFQLKQGQEHEPDITATFAFSAPTGIDSFVAGPTLVSQPSLGDGFWTLSGDILFINNIDPLVFFYGFGTRQGIERNFFGVTFAPGQEYNYNFGVGFAVNERVTLSGAFFGAYITEIHANGRRIQGTIREPLSMRFSATIARKNKKLLEPFVEIGMTDDAAAGTFGLIQTY